MVSYTKPDSLTEDPNEPPGGYSHTHTFTHTDSLTLPISIVLADDERQ